MNKTLLIASLLLSAFSLKAQLMGINSSIPPDIQWRQLNTDTVRVVYPEGLESQARRIGGMIHYMAKNNTGSMGEKVRKIDLFLLDKTVISNGYVAAPPFHSKFFTQAPQSSFAGTTDWLDLLAIHEYRHVQQMSNGLNGVTKWLYYAFGEILWAGAAHLAAPPWFWEGDAVIQETLLSHSGRGTVPSFGVYLKIIADQEDPFSYEKMVCGSFRDVVPNHYHLGYALSIYGRTQYGNDFWRDIYKEAVSYKRVLWPFSSALNARTDLRTADLYEKMMIETSSAISDQSIALDQQMLGENGLPTTYSYPKFKDEHTLIVRKSDYKTASCLMKVDIDGDEEKLFPVGYGMGTFDVYDDVVVWNEIRSHPRWSDVSYSNLFKHDLSTGKTKQLTDQSRYFAPSISGDGNKILVMETEEGMKNYLTILELESGKLIQRIPSPGNAFVTFPVWMDGESIAWVAQKNNKQAVLTMDLNSGRTDTLVAAQYRLIEYLQFQKGYLYYLSNTSNQKNQVVRLDLKSRQITMSHPDLVPYLVDMPEISPAGKVAFISSGFNQKKLAIVGEKAFFSFEKKTKDIDDLDQLYRKGKSDYALFRLAKEEGGILPDTFGFEASETNYTPGIAKLKFHSWILNPSIPNVSLMLQANDALGSTGFYIEPGYNFNEGTFFTKVKFSYGAYYPKVDLSLNTFLNRGIDNFPDESNFIIWDEWVLGGRVSIPLSSTYRNHAYRFSPYVGYKFIQTNGFRDLGNPSYHAAYAGVSYSRVQRSAYRSIYPRWGTSTNLHAQKVLNNLDQPVLDTRIKFYLPGFFKTHSTFIDTEFRYQDRGNVYVFPDDLYYSSQFGQLLSADWRGVTKLYYALPLAYPDVALGPFAFLKRLRMDVNYQVSYYQSALVPEGFNYSHRVGASLIADATYFRLLEIPVGVDLGFNFTNERAMHFDLRFIFGDR